MDGAGIALVFLFHAAEGSFGRKTPRLQETTGGQFDQGFFSGR